MPKISIIVVSYNSEEYKKQCLDSVFNQNFTDYEIIVIDNASNDRTVRVVRSLINKKINLEINDRNEGFPEAVNKGIGLSEGEHILVLNADAVLGYNFLSEISKNIETLAKDIGMIGVKILKKDSSEKIIDSTGLKLSNAIRFFDTGKGEKDNGQYDKTGDLFGPCAAAGIYRKELLEDIKIDGEYFDEKFFCLIEDFDVALRARRKGWKSVYLPDAVCYHVRNGSGMSYRYRQYLAFRNRYFFIIKNIEIKPYFLFYFAIYDLPRLVFMMLTNPYTLRAIKEIKQHLPDMLEKRRKIFLKKAE